MKKLVLSLAAMLSCLAANADTNPTVTIKYEGTSATITIPSEASSYVTQRGQQLCNLHQRLVFTCKDRAVIHR